MDPAFVRVPCGPRITICARAGRLSALCALGAANSERGGHHRIVSCFSVSGFLMSAFCRGGGAPYNPAGGLVSNRDRTDASLQLLANDHVDLLAGDAARAQSTAGRAWR